MLGRPLVALLLLSSVCVVHADIQVAKTTVYTQLGAAKSDLRAAEDLRAHLSKIVRAELTLKENAQSLPGPAILVGQGPLAEKLFPEIKWKALGQEEVILKTRGNVLLVAGGKPRGTLYAVSRLLHRLGVRWWAPWANTIPDNPKLAIKPLDVREAPAFEYRDLYWFHAFDADWAVHNYNNGFNTKVGLDQGGRIEYEGFVHTYAGYAPPEKYFGPHPEWYSEIDGYRRHQDAQLCTTNVELRKHILAQVKERLKANPRAKIVSISQNDCYNPCTCKVCKAQAESEGSQSALVLDLANYIGEGIEKEFPDVAVDTLAYQWSRHPPRTMKPRPNVIVRLCSIECNFAFPLDAPQNASFGDDIRGWSKLTNRLYIWNYTTDFAHYIQPQPDYYTLGPTIKFFANHGAKGVFEQGAYQSNGGDMAEMKAWVMAQLLWDPKQDDKALIEEFLDGYYGEAAPAMKSYLDLMAKEAQGWNLTFASPTTASFLRYGVMRDAYNLWTRARTLGTDHNDTTYTKRVDQSFLPMLYVWLSRWSEFRHAARVAGHEWPAKTSRKEVADLWLAFATTATDRRPPGMSPITHVNEGGLTPQQFVARFAVDPEEPDMRPLPPRKKAPYPPLGVRAGLDAQDDLADLWQAPDDSQLRADPLASDGIACWMPGRHHEWAFQLALSKLPALATGTWKVYAVVRVDSGPRDNSAAFAAGIYDEGQKKDVTMSSFQLDKLALGYAAYDLGTFKLNDKMRVWVAPPANPKVKAVWVDRIYFVKV